MSEVEKPKYKFPKAMGACADRLYQLRQKRLEMQKDRKSTRLNSSH